MNLKGTTQEKLKGNKRQLHFQDFLKSNKLSICMKDNPMSHFSQDILILTKTNLIATPGASQESLTELETLLNT
jgi:hypothetical protein